MACSDLASDASATAVEPSLVFLGVKSATPLETGISATPATTGHGWGCWSSGSAFVWADGTTAPLRSKASNRCPGCARIAAYEAMTMLRQDAEEHSAPGHVVTLTSRDEIDADAYREACRLFWRAFRRRWGAVEFCGFVEWTTGRGPRSGGIRRLHSHWLVKSLTLGAGDYVTRATTNLPCTCGDASRCVECWTAAHWRSLTGAWIVQARELRSVGGVVGYLALHHEKMEQAPPAGWTGRRLRPSKGYFAQPGLVRLQRARAWLVEHSWQREGLDEGAMLARAQRGAPRLVGALAEWEKEAREVTSTPGRSFDSLPERVALEERLRDPDAPINWDPLDKLIGDEDWQRRIALQRARFDSDLDPRPVARGAGDRLLRARIA